MDISILTTGSRGDVQPFIALGLALAAKGHAVRIAAPENFRGFVESYGLSCVPVRGDVSKIASSELMRGARNADSPLRFFTSMRNETIMGMLVDMQQDLHAACEGADAIVYHPAAVIGFFVAQEMGVPSVLASPFPMAPTSDYPALVFYTGPRFGGLYNRLTHAIFERGFWMILKTPLATYWKSRFGSLPAGFGPPYSRQRTSTNPTVVSCSPAVFPISGVFREHVHHRGYWYLGSKPGYSPARDLAEFISAGDPPVYVGFGSIGDAASASETTALVVEALRRVGVRGVLATGWSGMVAAADERGDMRFITEAPHDWLFPRMSVVVHHGGAGTTAAALRAGVPSVIVPFGNDQFAWGARVFELGVGSKPVPRKRLTSGRLSDAVTCCRNDDVRARASAMGERIRGERGAERAADVVLSAVRDHAAERRHSVDNRG